MFLISLNAEIVAFILSFRKSRHKPNLENTSKYGFSQQGRLLSDWLICFPGTQTLFEHALPKILKTKMASERAISCHDFVLEFQENVGGFFSVLLFRMTGKCWVIKLKRFLGYRSRFYWQATVSLVASSASCCRS